MLATNPLPSEKPVDWKALIAGKFVDVVWPATQTVPELFSAIAVPASAEFPPRYVLKLSADPAELTIATNASTLPDFSVCSELTLGKSGDVVLPVIYAFPALSRA